jgi:hypothetical protein
MRYHALCICVSHDLARPPRPPRRPQPPPCRCTPSASAPATASPLSRPDGAVRDGSAAWRPNPATTSVTSVCTYADLTPRSMRTYRSAEADIAAALHGQGLPLYRQCGVDVVDPSNYNRADRYDPRCACRSICSRDRIRERGPPLATSVLSREPPGEAVPTIAERSADRCPHTRWMIVKPSTRPQRS